MSRLLLAVLTCWCTLQAQPSLVSLSGPGDPGDGRPPQGAVLRFPASVAVDADGALIVADRKDHRIRRFDLNGNTTTLAGTGTPGRSPVGSRATEASIHSPSSVAIDPQGRVVFADAENCRILRIERDGTLQSITGVEECDAGTDGTDAKTRHVTRVQSIVYDRSGNLLFTDTDSHRIRQVTPVGDMVTLAGTGQEGSLGDGGAATRAQITEPRLLTVDDGGTIYFNDGPYRIRAVSQGVIRTVVGTGRCCTGGESERRILASGDVDEIRALYVTSLRTLLVGFSGSVRQLTADGFLDPLWGMGEAGNSGDNGSAVEARIADPVAVGESRTGEFFLVDAGVRTIRRISNEIINTIAGSQDTGDNRAATDATLLLPRSAASTQDGSIVFVDEAGFRVRRINVNGAIVTIAGSGEPGIPSTTKPATEERFNPLSVAVDAQGVVYIGALDGIYRLTSNGRLERYAGVPEIFGDIVENDAALSSPVFWVTGLTFDATGNLYLSEGLRNVVRRIDPFGIVTTVAGNPGASAGFRGDDGPARDALLNFPEALAFDAAGNLYIADSVNQRVRRVTPAGIISTVAGSGKFGFAGDGGRATSAEMANPSGVATDGEGNLYIADRLNGRLRRVTPGGVISTLTASSLVASDGSALLLEPVFVIPHLGGLLVGDAGTMRLVHIRQQCTYELTPAPLRMAANGGLASLGISTQAGCPWQVVNTQDWVVLGARPTGTGTATLPYVVRSNTSASARTAVLTVGSMNVRISQDASAAEDAHTAVRSGPLGVGTGTVLVASSAPALYTFTNNGVQRPVAYFANENVLVATPDSVPNWSSREAHGGDILLLRASGLGRTQSEVPAGRAFPAGVTYPIQNLDSLAVRIADRPARITFAGMVSPGLWFLILQVPEGIPAGEQSVVLTVDGKSTDSGLTLTFKE